MRESKNRSAQEDLRATSDAIRHDAQRLAQLEKEKSKLDPSDPRREKMARDIEKLVSEIADKAKAERELGQAERAHEGERKPD